MKAESKTVVCQGMKGDGNEEVLVKGYKVSVMKNK